MERARVLMEKYRDTPMDLADASLVVLGEAKNLRRVFRLDSGFLICGFQTLPDVQRTLKVAPGGAPPGKAPDVPAAQYTVDVVEFARGQLPSLAVSEALERPTEIAELLSHLT